MKRRDFLKKAGLGAAAVAATTVNAPAVLAQKKYRWKMVTTWPKNFPVLGTSANKLGELIGQTDAKGQVTEFQFDELDRVTLVDYPGGDTRYIYDDEDVPFCQGRLARAIYDSGSESLVYDERGQVVSHGTRPVINCSPCASDWRS